MKFISLPRSVRHRDTSQSSLRPLQGLSFTAGPANGPLAVAFPLVPRAKSCIISPPPPSAAVVYSRLPSPSLKYGEGNAEDQGSPCPPHRAAQLNARWAIPSR